MLSAVPQQCSASELKEMLASDHPPCILDVREAWELEICRLQDCIHIPLSELPRKIDELPRDQDIVVVCHHGVRSLQAAAIIRMQGLTRTINLRGGIHSWAEQIDPLMNKY